MPREKRIVRLTLSPELDAGLQRALDNNEPIFCGPRPMHMNSLGSRSRIISNILSSWLESRGYWAGPFKTRPLLLQLEPEFWDQLEAISTQVHEGPAQTAERMLQAHLDHCEKAELTSVKAGHLATAIRAEIEHLQELLEDLKVVVPVKPVPDEVNN